LKHSDQKLFSVISKTSWSMTEKNRPGLNTYESTEGATRNATIMHCITPNSSSCECKQLIAE